MTDQPWNDITDPDKQPSTGQRILVRLIGGAVRIAEYDKFNFNCWAIREWKAMPNHEKP